MSNFLLVARQVWILFALIGAGALCRRAKLLDDAAAKGIVNVLILAVTPCLIVDVFQRPFDPAMLRQLGVAFGVVALNLVLAAALVSLAVRRGDANARPVLRLAVVFSNAGFMGIPLEQAILGDRGVFFGIAYVAVFNLFVWSWGVWEMMNVECRMKNEEGFAINRLTDSRLNRRNEPLGHCSKIENRKSKIGNAHSSFFIHNSSFIINPGTVGLAVGLPLFLCSVKLPEMLAAPVGMMASLNTPLAMLVIGYHLAGARLGAVLRSPAAYATAFVRLVACPLALVAALYPFRAVLDREMMLALTIAASAPVAAMVTMFAAKFGRDVDLSVGLVSGTTLLSVLTMPAVIAFALSVL